MNKNIYSINNNKILSFFLHLINFFGLIFIKKTKITQKSIKDHKKILISNIAHLGDVILSLGTLPILKREFPDAKIYFLCGSWSNAIVKDHPLIDSICNFDHYKLNRSNVFFLKKILKHIRTRKETLKFLKSANFPLGIDLRLYFPNSSLLLYKGGVLTRLGYTSAGFECLLTHKLNFEKKNIHITRYYADLLNLVLKNPIQDNQILPILNFKNESSSRPLLENLPKEFYVIHIGAGDKQKMMELCYWIEIKNLLLKQNKHLVFTGQSYAENLLIKQIIGDSDGCINLCDQLGIRDLFFVIKRSAKLICVDTLVIHIAAALGIPSVVFYSKINNHHNWIFKKKNIKVVEFDPKSLNTVIKEELNFI